MSAPTPETPAAPSLLWRLTLRMGLGVWLAACCTLIGIGWKVNGETGEVVEAKLEDMAAIYQQLPLDVLSSLPAVDLKQPNPYVLHTAFSLYQNDRVLASNIHPPLPRTTQTHLQHLGEAWTIYTTPTAPNRMLIVGTPKHVQHYLAMDVASDLWPLIAAIFLALAAWTVWGIWRGLEPLRNFAQEVAARPADDLRPFAIPVPQETQAVQHALNQLLTKIANMLTLERRFIADAAHELRTPLAGIQMGLELALSSPREEARERGLRNAQQATLHAGRLVEQLLALARLDAQQEAFERIEIGAHLAHYLAEYGDAVCYVEGTSQPIDVALDWLDLLLRNALDNAFRYGATQVDVRWSHRTLTIQDNGAGVKPDVLARLGERFYRPLGQAASGSGIGISLMQQIAACHHAEFALSSPPDQGLCITLRFPEKRQPRTE